MTEQTDLFLHCLEFQMYTSIQRSFTTAYTHTLFLLNSNTDAYTTYNTTLQSSNTLTLITYSNNTYTEVKHRVSSSIAALKNDHILV
jgi:hypothetical protein